MQDGSTNNPAPPMQDGSTDNSAPPMQDGSTDNSAPPMQDAESNNPGRVPTVEVTLSDPLPSPPLTDGLADVPMEDRDIPGSEFYQTGNNSGRLSGPVVGTGEVNNADLRVRIPYDITLPNPSIEVRQVYLTRRSSGRSSLIAVLRNTSAQLHCFIRLGPIELVDLTGAVVPDALIVDEPFATGSQSSGRVVYTSTCLAPGERGYVTMSGSFDYRSIGRATVVGVQSDGDGFDIVREAVLPLSYSVDGSSLQVRIQNQGMQSYFIFAMEHVILDENGLPLAE